MNKTSLKDTGMVKGFDSIHKRLPQIKEEPTLSRKIIRSPMIPEITKCSKSHKGIRNSSVPNNINNSTLLGTYKHSACVLILVILKHALWKFLVLKVELLGLINTDRETANTPNWGEKHKIPCHKESKHSSEWKWMQIKSKWAEIFNT